MFCDHGQTAGVKFLLTRLKYNWIQHRMRDRSFSHGSNEASGNFSVFFLGDVSFVGRFDNDNENLPTTQKKILKIWMCWLKQQE